MRLASFVRIADGLDHAHLQDVKLKDLAIEPNRVRLRVGGVRYLRNLDAAERKADLWRHVFAVDFNVSGRLKSTGARYEGIAQSSDTVWEGVRRMLSYEYRIMDDMTPGMKVGESTGPLHDFRVALRRFRSLLRQFRRPLERTSAMAIRRELAVIGDELSHARDLDATWEFLTQTRVGERFRDDPDWPAYLDHLQTARRCALDEVRRLLEAPSFAAVMRRTERLLRVEIPDLQRDQTSTSICQFALNQVQRMRRRFQVTAEPGRDASAEEMHELRRLCRRYRYGSESLAPILAGPVHEWARLWKALSDALGGLNDMNVYLDRLKRHPPDPLPRALPAFLEARREECWASFQTYWDQIHRPKLRRQLKALNT
jgi:CHAD domain-containing protein